MKGKPNHIMTRHGFTIVEMLLALAVCGLVGLGVAAMLSGVTHATAQEQGTRERILGQQVLTNRITALCRAATMVLDADAQTLVLWTGDSDGSGQPRLGELRVLRWDSTDHTLWCYQTPEGVSPGTDSHWTLADNLIALTATYLDTSDMPGVLIGQGIDHWQVQLDASDPHDAALIRITFTYRVDGTDNPVTLIIAPGGRH